jgi:hypothetical protein
VDGRRQRWSDPLDLLKLRLLSAVEPADGSELLEESPGATGPNPRNS